MRLFVQIRVAALALGAAFALGGTAIAQQSTSPAPGVSVDWKALGQPAAPGGGLAIDWSALDALTPASPGAPGAIVLHPPPTPRIAVVAPPIPPAKPVLAAPKPVAPVVAVVPPRPPAPPRTENSPPSPGTGAAIPAAAPALVPGKTAMLRFAKGQSDVPADGQGLLNTVVAQLAANDRLRLQLVAYASASGSGDDADEGRRLALARAVQLRAYLIEKGVQSVRMDVRALGSRDVGDGPADRVDLVLVGR